MIPYLIIEALYDDNPAVQSVLQRAEDLFFSGQFLPGALAYERSEGRGYSGMLALNACKSYIRSGNCRIALKVLERMCACGFKDFWIVDSIREYLEPEDPRKYRFVFNRIYRNHYEYVSKAGIKYPEIHAALLEKVYAERVYRNMLYFKRLRGPALPEYSIDGLRELVRRSYEDSCSLLKEWLREFGFLGWRQIGHRALRVSWLIAQHADMDPFFREDYLDQFRQALNLDNASYEGFAYLTDRVRVEKGERQIYGTQVLRSRKEESVSHEDGGAISLWPVEDEARLDERRKAVGLSPIGSYYAVIEKSIFKKE